MSDPLFWAGILHLLSLAGAWPAHLLAFFVPLSQCPLASMTLPGPAQDQLRLLASELYCQCLDSPNPLEMGPCTLLRRPIYCIVKSVLVGATHLMGQKQV